MRDLAVALIVVALVAASFGAQALGFPAKEIQEWDLLAGIGLMLAVARFTWSEPS